MHPSSEERDAGACPHRPGLAPDLLVPLSPVAPAFALAEHENVRGDKQLQDALADLLSTEVSKVRVNDFAEEKAKELKDLGDLVSCRQLLSIHSTRASGLNRGPGGPRRRSWRSTWRGWR